MSIQAVAIRHRKKMQSEVIFHIWLNNISVLILLMRITRLVSNTCSKRKFSYTIKPWGRFLHLEYILLLLFRHRMPNYFIISEYIRVKFLLFLFFAPLRFHFKLKMWFLLKFSNFDLSSFIILRYIHVNTVVIIKFLSFLQQSSTFI